MVVTQVLILCCDTGCAVVQVTDAQVLTTQRDHRAGTEAKAFGAKNGCLDHIKTGFQATVCLYPNFAAQVITTQRLMRFRQPKFPWRTGITNGRQRRSTSAAVVTGDGNQVSVSLGHARGDSANTRLGYQLDRHQRSRINLFQVKDQLRQIFDGIDVVMRRWRNKCDARHSITQASNQLVYLTTRQLTTFAGLGTLRDLDLQHIGVNQILRRHTKASGRNLLDTRGTLGTVTRRVFTPLTGVGASAKTVHCLGNGLMRLRRQGSERDTRRVKALEYLLKGLNLVERDRRLIITHFQEVTQRRHRAVVYQSRVFKVLIVAITLHGILQRTYHIRVVRVVLTTEDKFQQATLLNRLAWIPGFLGQQ